MNKKTVVGRMKTSFIATALLVGSLLEPTASIHADDTLAAAEARTMAKEAFLSVMLLNSYLLERGKLHTGNDKLVIYLQHYLPADQFLGRKPVSPNHPGR